MKYQKILIILILTCISVCFLFSCNENEDNSTIQVDFVIDGKIFRSIPYPSDDFIVPVAPTVRDKNFDNWYFDKEYTMAFNIDEIEEHISGSRVKVYGNYSKKEGDNDKCIFTFMVNNFVYETKEFSKNAPFKMPVTPTLEYHTFVNWYIDPTFTTMFDYASFIKEPEFTDITLYAKFDKVQYTINLYMNNTLFDSVSYDVDMNIALPIPPLSDKQVFSHWEVKNTNSIFDISAFISNKKPQNIDLNAIIIKKYSIITLISQDIHINEIKLLYNDTLALPTLDDTQGYIFKGWLLDGETFDIASYNDKENRDDITLNAKWDERITKVNFYVDDELYSSKTVDSNLILEEPKSPHKSGYIFNDWYIKNGEKSVPFDKDEYLNTIDRQDIELHAKFDISSSKVTFKVDENIYLENEVNSDNLLIMPANPKKDGYIFVKWMCNGREFSIKSFNEKLANNEVVNSEYVLTAVFKPIEYKLQFIALNKEHALIIYSIEKDITLPTNPIIEGYRFDGWYIDKSYSKEFNLDDFKTSKEKHDMAIYAKMTKI